MQGVEMGPLGSRIADPAWAFRIAKDAFSFKGELLLGIFGSLGEDIFNRVLSGLGFWGWIDSEGGRMKWYVNPKVCAHRLLMCC